ncbi:MAG: hypothetical protein HY817_00255 [Candidatus Abawacabacteria bacterium]|nr:hypothetical protein [Candidatus Abawacabacteria bacterium]
MALIERRSVDNLYDGNTVSPSTPSRRDDLVACIKERLARGGISARELSEMDVWTRRAVLTVMRGHASR